MSRLELPSHPLYVGAAAAFAAELAERSGFAAAESQAIRAAVDEACSFVVQRALDPEQTFTIKFELGGHGLSIRLTDRNLPVDSDELSRLEPGPDPRTLGLVIMRALMDEVRLINRGRQGNEIVLVKRLKARFSSRVRKQEKVSEEPLEPVTVRLVQPEEAVGVSRCLYQAYGYSYTGYENVYRPEWVREMNRQGRLISAVAVTDSGEVVGHTALVRMLDDRPIYEMGQGAVVPRYRGQGLLRQLVSFLVEQARLRQLRKLYADPVTSHLFAQKVVLDLGFCESALMLGAVGPEETHPEPSSLMIAVRSLTPEKESRLHLPPGYAAILTRTMEKLGLQRRLHEPASNRPPLQGALTWGLQAASRRALFHVERVGRNTPRELGRCLNEIQAPVQLVDLELADPHTDTVIDLLRERGFGYCGFFPGLGGQGDLLRMQRLGEPVRADLIQVASPWGQELLDFVLEDRRG
ncbi:MAG: hypothetical protein AMXMBFR33_09220 [Candidatus Xenobia bacterium]